VSPFSGPVLWPSLALSSPVLLGAVRGSTTWPQALDRFLIVLVVCWVAVSVVHALAFPDPGAAPQPVDAAESGDPRLPGD
jgi:hypothetical protein